MKNKLYIALAVLFVGVGMYSYAFGADYLPKDKESGGNVVVSGPEEYKNLYVGGGSIIINQNILGDLFAAGGSVNVASTVEEDLFAVGGNVTVSAPVNGDVRVAGGNVVINAPVSGDVLVAGGTVSLGANASVGGDLWVAGGVVNITGPVTGNLKVAGGEIYINSSVGGTLDIQADKKMTFGPSAIAMGNISYCGMKDPVIESGAQIGSIDRKPVSNNTVSQNDLRGLFFGLAFLKILALFIAGIVLLRLVRKRITQVVSITKEKFWHNLGVGLIGMIVIPLVSFLLFITVVGGFLGIILFLWFLFATILCGIVSVIVLGSFMEKWMKRKKATVMVASSDMNPKYATVLLGALGGLVLSVIPLLGWLVLCGVYLATFGGMLKMVKSKIIDA